MGKILASLDRGTPTLNQMPPEPEPALAEKRESLRKSLGVSSLDNTFENFKPMKGTEKAVVAFKSMVEGNYKRKLLLCYGGVGNGKTHLCEATAIELKRRGLFCSVRTMDMLMSALKECMNPEAHLSYEELLRNYSYADRMIVDDVDGTEWAFGELEKIIRVRYRERLFTILTTNRDITELPERITSRFFDPEIGTVCLNSAEDYRKYRLRGKG